MATEITKTLDEVGGFVVQDDSRLETLIPDSVAQTEENGAENNHVDVGENLNEEKGVSTVSTTTTTTEVVEIQTTIEMSFQVQGPTDEIEMEVDRDVVADGLCESKAEEEEKKEEEEGLASLAVAENEAEMNNDLNEDSEKNVDLEKMDIDLNGEEDEQEENKDDMETSEEDGGEENEGYLIGDLVWGKIRSHPWWPGQIYHPSDASDFAKKQKSSGHLVAYFGDGSFSWCSPSQLRHIEEDFDEKSRQNNSKNFSTAVDNALDEVIRLVKLKMTCSCISIEPERQLVENAGIKQGVLVPDHGISLLKTVGFESNALLANIKSIAKIGLAKNRLEVATITGLLSAFNRAKGGYGLAVYNDPCYIDGLEDKKKKDVKKMVLSHLNIPDEIVSDEDFSSLKKKGAESSVDLHQRKKKSVADLLKESKTVKNDDLQTPTPTTKKLKSGKKSKTTSESSHKKTKTKMNENNDNNEKGGDEENVEIVHTPRERKRSKYLSPPYTNPNAFFSKRDFKSDSIEAAKNEPVMNYSESSAKTNSPVTSDSFLVESDETAKDVLSVLKCAALDPLDLKKKNPLGITKGILRSFREAYYLNGSNYKVYHQIQRVGKKRNLDNSRSSLGKKKLKPCGEEIDPTLLLATFPPGFSLPSKDKIIGMFSKFGLLNETLTEVSYNSYCARIAFVNSSDAEEAFKACSLGEEKANPFGDDDAAAAAADKVKYRLGFASCVKVDEKPKTENGEDKKRLVFIKKKLQKMTSMLEKCDGSLSGERKKKLEDEMKGLLGKVSEMF